MRAARAKKGPRASARGRSGRDLRALFGRQGRRLGRGTRVLAPVELAGGEHHEAEDGEERRGAGEQGLVLHPEDEEEKPVDAAEGGRDDEGAAPAPQDTDAVERDEQGGGEGGGEVGGGAGNEFREREQTELEKDEGSPDEGVMKDVQAQRGQYIEEEEGGEKQDD